jgi:transcriptional regulator with XRE-family HTH domain
MTPDELRKLRKALKLTQRELADLLKYKANHIAKLERGEAPITERFATLVRLRLLGGKQTPPD